MRGLGWLLALALVLAAPAMAEEFAESEGATLRFLDKLTSETGDVTLSRGQSAQFGRLVVQLDACRYPAANPASDANAHLTVVDGTTNTQLFGGWMLASSPALSALDHPRYDVWVLSCVLPEATEPPPDPATVEGEGQ
jgi:hypothetical protein